MKKALRYAALFAACFLISAAVIAIMELIFTSAIDIEKVLTISIGPTLCYGVFGLLRLIKKESAEDAAKQ